MRTVLNWSRRVFGGITLPGGVLSAFGRTGGAAAVFAIAVWLLAFPVARADWYASDMWDNGLVNPGTMIYPNWSRVWCGSFVVELCDILDCPDAPTDPTERVTGVTIVNFGTASSADIAKAYWVLGCNGAAIATYTMTYDGVYAEDTGAYPAWTWSGATADLSACAPICTGCTAGSFSMDLYVDVAACPAEMVSVNMGFPLHNLTNTTYGGSVTDNQDQAVPWQDLPGGAMNIMYMLKDASVDTVAPGDTVTYTIFYGRPGASLSSIEIFDTIPQYTHYLAGTGSPAPDAAWGAPNVGPPQTLRWTIPGPLPVAGGPTGMITFSVSVDWGNGESFEPGSGDVGAPEGPGLQNAASAIFNGATGCPKNVYSQAVGTTIRRYLFWKLGDNDVVFAGRLGLPDDEMTYSVFAKNVSATKTWWSVHVWDTVPAEMNVWPPEGGFGFEDPCAGWTMTPTGCASGNPGVKLTAGGKTLLTWELDLPPLMTVELKWKARVSATAKAFTTVINQAAIQAWGQTGIVDGTGHSGKPKVFTHLASVVLRTTYLSYVGTGSANAAWNQCEPFIVFFPLNRATDFELRGIEYDGLSAFAVAGGVSASIGPLIGTCVGGLVCAGSTGCGPERAPTHYSAHNLGCVPNGGPMSPTYLCPTFPFHFIYKMVSNAPVLWMVFPVAGDQYDDGHTFTPSTSLSFSGMMHYTFLREDLTTDTVNDQLNFMNTSIDSYGVYSPTLDTTVIDFRWNPVTKDWEFWDVWEIDPDSVATRGPVGLGEQGYFRIVSSQAKLVVHQWANGAAVVMNHLSPTRETGATSSKPGAGYTFYVFPGADPFDTDRRMAVTNMGATPATYRIDWYKPRKPFPAPWGVSPWQADTSGTWQTGPTDSVDPGLVVLPGPTGNAHCYGPPWDPSTSFKTPDGNWGIWRVVQLAGGPLEVTSGQHFGGQWGGSMVHASNGSQTGQQFWVSQFQTGPYWYCDAPAAFGGKHPCECAMQYGIYAIDVFCPKTNMAVKAVTGDGSAMTYTTTGPDQCIMFTGFTMLNTGGKRNIRIDLLAGGSQGNMICQYINCTDHQRMFCAPFMVVGTHYDIIMPPVAFIGQSMWITIIVVDAAGSTKDDYCGTTSFTSTDPAAKIEGAAMDLYNYTWKSSTLPCAACGASCDNGVRVFLNVSFSKLGEQTIVAGDTTDGSITGLAAIMVVGVDVRIFKEPRFSLAASADTVSFKVCWSNYSTASAFTFVINDAVPMGMTFLPEGSVNALSCGNTDGLTPAVAYSTATTPAVPPAGSFTGGNPVTNTRWLRWTIPYAGVQTTGCVCYRVLVN